MKSRDKPQDINQANDIAVQALSFLVEDVERMGRFLALSGLDPSSIREAAQEPGFLLGVLDHVLSDERLLIAFAVGNDLRPEQVAEARSVLAGPSVH